MDDDALHAGHGPLVVIGASAGGVEALSSLVRGLPSEWRTPILVVLHLSAAGRSVLPSILERAGPVRATHAVDGERITAGRIYVAPPDSHLLVDGDHVRLQRGPTENGHRPAIDPLFRSAARARGAWAIGVILSGVLDDGVAGLREIKNAGGLAVVQDPDDALYSSMPSSAVARVEVDAMAPASELAGVLASLVAKLDATVPTEPGPARDWGTDLEQDDPVDPAPDEHLPGELSRFTCPDCQGSLWEYRDGQLVRFRCHVGHVWTEAGLVAEQARQLDTALWTALRVLGERIDLAQRLAERASERGHAHVERLFRAQVDEYSKSSAALERVLVEPEPVAADALAEIVAEVLSPDAQRGR